MSSDEPRYQFTEVTTLRGTEQRSIAKKHSEGWEFIDQQQGAVKTTLRFRRPKPPVPWKLVAAGGGVLVVLFAIMSVGAFREGNGEATGTGAVAGSVESPAESSGPVSGSGTEGAVDVETSDILTVDSSPALAAILQETDQCSPAITEFAKTHAGRTIQFDGHIAALYLHGNYDTRYDVLLSPRDYDESDGRGPSFQYRDINLIGDPKWRGSGIPDTVTVNDRFRFTATVDAYEQDSCLFLLEPVATEAR